MVNCKTQLSGATF